MCFFNEGDLKQMDELLTIKLLPATLICHNFVNGISDCNYEIYLMEIVNHSEFFIKKSGGEPYCAPAQESNGENDCFSCKYSFDFKLMASETLIRATNLFSKSVYSFAPGCIGYGSPKVPPKDKKYKPIDATRIFAAVRKMTLDELLKIRERDVKMQGIERDVCALLEKMEVQKNLMFFFPYEFFSTSGLNFDAEVNEIISALNSDFKETFKYRNLKVQNMDTYVVFLYDGFF